MTIFPDRVWEITGKTEDGEPLWSSREATPDDWQRRTALKKILERQYTAAELPMLREQAA
jgi:hypothetical protein